MVRQVLVTLDGSVLSQAVIRYLPAILRTGDAVLLLTVSPMPRATSRPPVAPREPIVLGSSFARLETLPPDYAEDEQRAIERRRSELREYLEDEGLFLRNEGFEVRCDVVFNPDAAKAIIEYARQNGPLFIAMATHGRGGISHAVQGSVTEQVIRSGVAPVLVVRP